MKPTPNRLGEQKKLARRTTANFSRNLRYARRCNVMFIRLRIKIIEAVETKKKTSLETQGNRKYPRGVYWLMLPGKSIKTCQNTSKMKIRTGSAIHHAARHVLAVARIALDHHGCRFEDRHSNLCHRKLLMVSLLRRDDRSIGGQHEVNAWVRHQIGLEPWILHNLAQQSDLLVCCSTDLFS